MTTDLLEAPRPLSVLLVEDDPGDVVIAREAMAAGQLSTRLDVVTDGVEAMAYLRHEDGYADVHRPDLILLDLNMPKMDGREVLAYIKTDEYLKTIPVVILTTSEFEGDITKSYQLAANCYLNKPVELEEFEILIKSINDFWLSQVRLPREAALVD